MSKNDSAFPQEVAVGNVYKIEGGLTKREYLAMKLYVATVSLSDSVNFKKESAKRALEVANIFIEASEEESK